MCVYFFLISREKPDILLLPGGTKLGREDPCQRLTLTRLQVPWERNVKVHDEVSAPAHALAFDRDNTARIEHVVAVDGDDAAVERAQQQLARAKRLRKIDLGAMDEIVALSGVHWVLGLGHEERQVASPCARVGLLELRLWGQRLVREAISQSRASPWRREHGLRAVPVAWESSREQARPWAI